MSKFEIFANDLRKCRTKQDIIDKISPLALRENYKILLTLIYAEKLRKTEIETYSDKYFGYSVTIGTIYNWLQKIIEEFEKMT